MPAAAASAKGIAARAPPSCQRSAVTASAPSARIMGNAVISLTEPSSS